MSLFTKYAGWIRVNVGHEIGLSERYEKSRRHLYEIHLPSVEVQSTELPLNKFDKSTEVKFIVCLVKNGREI